MGRGSDKKSKPNLQAGAVQCKNTQKSLKNVTEKVLWIECQTGGKTDRHRLCHCQCLSNLCHFLIFLLFAITTSSVMILSPNSLHLFALKWQIVSKYCIVKMFIVPRSSCIPYHANAARYHSIQVHEHFHFFIPRLRRSAL